MNSCEESSRYHTTFKVMTVGDNHTGRNCFVNRIGADVLPTTKPIGVDFVPRDASKDGVRAKVLFWNQIRDDGWKVITSSYYRNADMCVLIFDITSRSSFENLPGWIEQIRRFAPEDVLKILVGTKGDLAVQRQVAMIEIDEFCAAQGLRYIETSARDNINIVETRGFVLDQLFEKYRNKTPDPFVAIPLLKMPRTFFGWSCTIM